VRTGGDPYAGAPSVVPPYVYPPLLAQAGALLDLPRETAYRALSTATGIAGVLALGLTLLYRAGRSGAEDDAPALALGLALFLLLPFRDTLAQGQVNGLALAAVTLALWLEGRGRPLAAGVALAPAVLLKVTPAVFALRWLARRRGPALAGLGAGVLALTLGSLVAGGSASWASYLRFLRALAAGAPPPGLPPVDALFNISLAGFFARLLPPALAVPAAALALLVSAALVLRAIARADTPEAEHAALLALLALTVMAPPLAYRHHVVLLFPGALLFLMDARRAGTRGRAALVLLGLVLASVNFPGRAAYAQLDAAGGAARLAEPLRSAGALRRRPQRFCPWVSYTSTGPYFSRIALIFPASPTAATCSAPGSTYLRATRWTSSAVTAMTLAG
jgi:hypothetical protein